MGKENKNSLVIVALVGIVAIVGLVILFTDNANTTGMVPGIRGYTSSPQFFNWEESPLGSGWDDVNTAVDIQKPRRAWGAFTEELLIVNCWRTFTLPKTDSPAIEFYYFDIDTSTISRFFGCYGAKSQADYTCTFNNLEDYPGVYEPVCTVEGTVELVPV